MIKVIALVTRKDGMSREEFREYWVTTHSPLAAAMPGLRGYRINIAGTPRDRDSESYDGSAELWFDDREAMEVGMTSMEGEVAFADVPNFASNIVSMVTHEHVIVD